jgi:hypothetical protein
MKWIHGLSLFGAAVLLAGCAAMGGSDALQVRMTGAEEVPPVSTSASGSGTITVSEDRSVSGSFKLQNAAHITAAHIHVGPAGKTGPVIIPLQKTADNEWVVPPGAKLNESQYQSYKAGGFTSTSTARSTKAASSGRAAEGGAAAAIDLAFVAVARCC